jgi:hypothetical protein
MFSLFNNSSKRSFNIILDIQSGLVRGSVIEKDELGKLHVSLVVTKTSTGRRHKDAVHLTKDSLKLVDQVVSSISKDISGKTINSINYVLSSPWVFSKIKTIKNEYGVDTDISNDLIEGIINDEFKKGGGSDSTVIDRKIFEVKLNGYVATNFDNKRAHSVEISVASSVASKEYISRLDDTVKHHLTSKKYTYNSASLLQFVALRNIFTDSIEYTYIHTHSELTDFVVVKSGQCKTIGSYPIGINTILNKLSNSTNHDLEALKSTLSLYQDGKLSESEMTRLGKIIDPIMEEWTSSLVSAININESNIPKTVYLAAHGYFNIFKESILKKITLNIVEHDLIKVDSNVVFDKYANTSNMVKMYAIALHDVL